MEPHLKTQNTDVFHSKYADVLVSLHDYSGAYKHYNTALKINSDSAKAKDGLARLELLMAEDESEDRNAVPIDEDDDMF